MTRAPGWRRKAAACIAGALVVAIVRAQQPVTSAGPDLAGMDRTILPGDDFFGFANGGWVRTTEMPADRGQYGNTDLVAERTEIRLAGIIQKAAQTPAPAGSDLRLAGDYYAAYMDEDAIEARGLHPLDARRNEIGLISDRHELARYIGATLRTDVDALNATSVVTDNLFGLWVAQDLDSPERYVPFLLQGGLGMPDRSYYLDPAPAMAAIRAQYAAHLRALLQLTGTAEPAARAQRVIELEQRIAAVQATRDETRDVRRADNHWRRSDFHRLAPGLDWTSLFDAAGLPGAQRDLVVWQPGAIRGIAALVGSEPLATWKDYLWVHAVEHRAALLPKAIVAEHFAFYGTVLRGVPQQRARWKRALAATDGALGDALGRLYVARYFPPEDKARVEAIVAAVRAALSRRIAKLDWLSAQGKSAAQAKLAAIRVGVGYPDQWRDYAGLAIVRNDAFGNAERAGWFEYRRQLAKLGARVDRAEWVIAPQEVNAVDLPAMNALNLAAGILQPPFYVPDGDPALNYGAIGAIIGHELAHSFDDRGGRFDAEGRLRDWWSEADAVRLREVREQLAEQYGGYQALPDRAVDGHLTLGENLADLAGLLAAFDAYHAVVPQRDAGSDGYNGDQRFFIAYAQSYRTRYRDEALRAQLIGDPHAPDRYRAATVRNLDAWYEAFDVRPGQSLYLAPAQRVRVW